MHSRDAVSNPSTLISMTKFGGSHFFDFENLAQVKKIEPAQKIMQVEVDVKCLCVHQIL